MNNDPLFWRDRYRHQVSWSRDTRRHILESLQVPRAARFLEVGSAFGALLDEMEADGFANGTGLDIDLTALRLAKSAGRSQACADGHQLPLRSGCMDVCLCHFFLLWVEDAPSAVREMTRVTRPGGWVIALAEPDYGGRIDHPPALAELGHLQRAALADQGAMPDMGRHLGALFHQAGLANITCGVLPAQWSITPSAENDFVDEEWQVLEKDLAGRTSPAELEALRRLEAQARLDGSRVLFVPTFYTCGQVN